MINILLSLICGAASAVLYRMGGMGGEGRLKYPNLPKWFFDSKIRDLGLPTLMTAYYLSTRQLHWSLFICFMLMFGSLTTYWKRKGSDAKWFNWLFTGLGYSICMLPFAISSGHYWGFIIRCLVVTATTVLWSQLIGKDWLEEGGRGFIINSTLWLI